MSLNDLIITKKLPNRHCNRNYTQNVNFRKQISTVFIFIAISSVRIDLNLPMPNLVLMKKGPYSKYKLKRGYQSRIVYTKNIYKKSCAPFHHQNSTQLLKLANIPKNTLNS